MLADEHDQSEKDGDAPQDNQGRQEDHQRFFHHPGQPGDRLSQQGGRSFGKPDNQRLIRQFSHPDIHAPAVRRLNQFITPGSNRPDLDVLAAPRRDDPVRSPVDRDPPVFRPAKVHAEAIVILKHGFNEDEFGNDGHLALVNSGEKPVDPILPMVFHPVPERIADAIGNPDIPHRRSPHILEAVGLGPLANLVGYLKPDGNVRWAPQ